jgi:hypothetical protein
LEQDADVTVGQLLRLNVLQDGVFGKPIWSAGMQRLGAGGVTWRRSKQARYDREHSAIGSA